MKRLLLIAFTLSIVANKIAAQQNWAAIPCSKMDVVAQIQRMFVDSLHNEIILQSFNGYSICNTYFKGPVAYNGSGFHDLDGGTNTHYPGLSGGVTINDCITFGNKTLFGGGFLSVGSNTLYTKSAALWDASVWDSFPVHLWSNALHWNTGGGLCSFSKHDGKLWMLGGFDTIGKTITNNITAFDGHTFTAIPSIPVDHPSTIMKGVWYKNKLVVMGNFYDLPNFDYFRLAEFDGTSWSQVGGGVRGNLSAPQDMAVYNDTLFIGGSFPKSAGNAGNYIMKWDGSQLTDAGLSNTFCGYGAIWSLVPYRNRLYAFGGFACATNQKAFGVAYYENGKWTVAQDSIEGNGIMDAVVYNDAIYIGGSFQSINGDTTIRKFAKLMCPDFDAKNGCISGLKESHHKLDLKVFPNPSKDKIQLEFEQSVAIDKVTIANTLGQEIYRLAKPTPSKKLTFRDSLREYI